MAVTAVSAAAGTWAIICDYDPTGRGWVSVHDTPVVAWGVDTAGATEAFPIIVGAEPANPPSTGDVVSPAWALFSSPTSTVFVPHEWRGSPVDFLVLLATNNDAQRSVYVTFADKQLQQAWEGFSGSYPGLVLSGVPTLTALPAKPHAERGKHK